jgi:hypothetical protein
VIGNARSMARVLPSVRLPSRRVQIRTLQKLKGCGTDRINGVGSSDLKGLATGRVDYV